MDDSWISCTERNQCDQSAKYCMILFRLDSRIDKLCRCRRDSWLLRVGEKEGSKSND